MAVAATTAKPGPPVSPSRPGAPPAGPRGGRGAPRGGRGGAGIPASSPLLNPTQTLSGPALYQSAQQIANAQTTGPISELAAQIAEQNRQAQGAQKDTFGYYMQLAKDAQAGLGQEQQIGQNLGTTLSGINTQTQGQLAQLGQQAQGGALDRLSQLGLASGQNQALQGEQARLQGLGAVNAGAFRSAGANQSANYQSNAAGNLGVDALAGTTAIGQIGQASRVAEEPLFAKIAALEASKGALTATALGQLRTAERNYQIAQQGLGIKRQSVANTAAYDKARIGLTASGQAITQQNDLANQKIRQAANAIAQQRANIAAGKAARGSVLSASGRAAVIQGIDGAQSIIKAYPGLSANDLNTLLTTGRLARLNSAGKTFYLRAPIVKGGAAGPIAQAAFELQNQGYITAGTARQLAALGFVVGNAFPTHNGVGVQVGAGAGSTPGF